MSSDDEKENAVQGKPAGKLWLHSVQVTPAKPFKQSSIASFFKSSQTAPTPSSAPLSSSPVAMASRPRRQASRSASKGKDPDRDVDHETAASKKKPNTIMSMFKKATPAKDQSPASTTSRSGRTVKSTPLTSILVDSEDEEMDQITSEQSSGDEDESITTVAEDSESEFEIENVSVAEESTDDDADLVESEEDSYAESEMSEKPAKKKKSSPGRSDDVLESSPPAKKRKLGLDPSFGASTELWDDVKVESNNESDMIVSDDESSAKFKAKKKTTAKVVARKLQSDVLWKEGLDGTLKPLSQIEDVFDDLVGKSLAPESREQKEEMKKVVKSYQTKKQQKWEKTRGLIPKGYRFPEWDSHLSKTTLEDAVNHICGRKLRVATMCSGTESPILALDLIRESLKRRGLSFEYEHLFSAEIVDYKQAYIERNFAPPIIFRDIKELSIPNATHATTAYGARVPIPGNVEMLIAGFSCVDFSNLNAKRKVLCELGESGDTFFAMRDYARVYKPKIILLENVQGAPWGELENFMAAIGYVCRHQVVDTKDYYLPHTRQRGYMMCINVEDEIMSDTNKTKSEKELIKNGYHGVYAAKFGSQILNTYTAKMHHLKRPASSSVEAFLLAEDDPRLVAGHRDMVSGSKNASKRVIDWTRCQGRHDDYRFVNGLGKGRPIFKQDEGGVCTPRDFQNAPWHKYQVERIIDVLEMNYLRSLLRGYDFFYKFRIIDLSQNIDRSEDTTGAGLTGCLTPSGAPYSTMRGGPVIGLESLALQGLPIDRLLFTRERQDQLQDLAGNAMSTTVVGAGIIASLIARYLALEPGTGKACKTPEPEVTEARVNGAMEIIEFDYNAIGDSRNGVSSAKAITVAKAMALAHSSFRACYCEGRNSLTGNKLQKCLDCDEITCVTCGRSQHRYAEYSFNRTTPSDFETIMLAALPMKLKINGPSEDDIAAYHNSMGFNLDSKESKIFSQSVEPIFKAFDAELRYHSMKRSKTWTINYISAFARLELIFFGQMVEWRLYALPDPELPVNHNLRKLFIRAVGRMVPQKTITDGQWELWVNHQQSFTAQLHGVGDPVHSQMARVGLIAQENDYTFPQYEISIPEELTTQAEFDVSGTYTWKPDCGMAKDSLLVRDTRTDAEELVYLYLDHGRATNPKDDHYIFSVDKSRLQYGEDRPVIAKFQAGWAPPVFTLSSKADIVEQDLAVVNDKTVEVDDFVKAFIDKEPAKSSDKKTAIIPDGMAKTSSGKLVPIDNLRDFSVKVIIDGCWTPMKVSGFAKKTARSKGVARRVKHTFGTKKLPLDCRQAFIMLDVTAKLPQYDVTSKWQKDMWLEVSELELKNFLFAFGWTSLKYKDIPGLEEWRHVDCDLTGQCQCCAPKLPGMKWKLNKEMKVEPFEDPTEAAPYERAMKARPRPLVVQVKIDAYGEVCLKFGVNPTTLMHRAAAKLVGSNTDDVEMSWHLVTDYVVPPRLELPDYQLVNNDDDRQAPQPPNFKFPLRAEQARSLTWMLRQEAEDVEPVVEEEVEESSISQIGWRAEGRAQRNVVVRGGVLADQVGYGKTITTLALIDSQRDEDMARVIPWEDACKNVKGYIPVKATLIFVPPQLPDQWANETAKFLHKDAGYKVVLIKTLGHLEKLTITEVKNADVIIVNWKVVEGEQYLFKIAQFAGVLELPENSPDRAQATWYENALKNVAKNVDILKSDATTLHDIIKKDLAAEGQAASETETYIPSKRLRGTAYQIHKEKLKAQQEESMKMANELWKGDNTFVPVDVDEAVKEKKVKEFVTKARKDVFGLQNIRKKANWTTMRSVFFEMFHFSRVVVDEFTYIAGNESLPLKHIQSRSRWILSGTPPLGDFIDIKSIATFLRINLGIDDFTPGVTQATNLKALTKNLTSVEKFRTFKMNPSDAWHLRRHGIAQAFLNRFVRQNIPRIDAIPGSTHIMPISLPGAEYAIYLEMNNTVLANDNRMVKGAKRFESEAAKRQRETFNNSDSPEEALLKTASSFDGVKDKGKGAIDACASIIKARTKQQTALEQQIFMTFKKAEWLKRKCHEPCEQYRSLGKHLVIQNKFGDESSKQAIVELWKQAQAESRPADGFLFYLTEEQKIAAKALEEKNKKAKTANKSKAKPKGGKRKRDDDEDDLSDFISDDEEEEDVAEIARKKKIMPQGYRGNVDLVNYELRDVVSDLRRLFTEHVNRVRCLRFFECVRQLQKWCTAIRLDDDDVEGVNCSVCNKRSMTPDDIMVLSGCGHPVCNDCLDKHHTIHRGNSTAAETCPTKGCGAINKTYQIIGAAELGVEDVSPNRNRHYGKKIEDIVHLLQHIPVDDQVLLFVQFPDLMGKIASALKDNGISVASLQSSADASKTLESFQDEKGRDKKKVLILNIGDASAAGSNLTNANHVIFVSPYLTDRQQTFDQAMTQAAGRARRYGQTKPVHTYHFLSLKTIDVDTYEVRHKCRLEETKYARPEYVPYKEFRPSLALKETENGDGLMKTVFGSSVVAKGVLEGASD